jgi:ABC-type transport system involved in multi-copper enzyme maturation permease subunit
MIQSFSALALNGFREARRNRVTLVVGFFALAMLLCTTLVTEVTVHTFDRVLTDVGLGVMSVMLVLLAIFLSSGLLSREIERRTVFLIVSKPISRSLFLVGRLAGNMLTLTVLLVGMAAVFFVEMTINRAGITSTQFVAIGVLWFELLVLSSFGFVMSSFSSQIVSAVVTTGIYFAGHLANDVYNISSKSKSEVLRLLGKATYYILPNLSRLNYRPQASYAVSVAPNEILSSVAYGAAYAGTLIVLAMILFSRRDFK